MIHLKILSRINSSTFFQYFIFLPFVYPKGFVTIPTYKMFFTLWTYLAAFTSVVFIVYKGEFIRTIKKPWVMGVIVYAFAMLCITLIVQHGVYEGFQKIFVTPIVCITFDYFISKSARNTINVFSNILIILLFLNDTIMCPYVFSKIINSYHVMFLGHVQVAAQFAILGMLMAILSLYVNGDKKRCTLLILLAVVTFLISDTSAGYISLIIIAFAYLVRKRKMIGKMFKMHPFQYSIASAILSAFLIYSAIALKLYNKVSFDLTYSGRVFVWQPAWEQVKEHWFIGYGIFGVKIKTFWSAWNKTEGMNYAHSELIQQLLDGGVVLLCVFGVMMGIYLSRIGKIKDKIIRYWCIVYLCCFLFLGLFESVTEYFYIYIFLSLICELHYTQIYYYLQRGMKYGN